MHHAGIASSHPTGHAGFHGNIGTRVVIELAVDVFEHARSPTRIDGIKLLVHLVNDGGDISLCAIRSIVSCNV